MKFLLTFLLCFAPVCVGLAHLQAKHRVSSWLRPKAATIDDKLEVETYFNNEGFQRWNNIYSLSDDVNGVQLDIRDGHQQTIDKVLKWISSEDNTKKTLCDAGCGVGSLAIPAASMFRKVYGSDISASMVAEAGRRAQLSNMRNIELRTADLEKLSGRYETVSCIDVMIHYPTEKMTEMVEKLGGLASERVILSFAPKTLFYQVLKKVGELFPGKSKATRAYLHAEEDVRRALKKAGFVVRRKEATATKFYFSTLLEAVRRTPV